MNTSAESVTPIQPMTDRGPTDLGYDILRPKMVVRNWVPGWGIHDHGHHLERVSSS